MVNGTAAASRLPLGTLGPTSLEFISHPNPVEPQSVPERHPLHDAQRFQKKASKQDQISQFLNPAPVVPHEPATKRQRVGDGLGQHLYLPKLPVRHGTRKPRLPPTLSGLHQPPPDARLLPSINVEKPHVGGENKTRSQIGNADTQGGSNSSVKQTTSHIAPPDGTISPLKMRRESEQQSEISPKAHCEQKQKQPRAQRRKWSHDETACLLQGVSKYGIGNWTKILRDDNFRFEKRTALDLKDRFRVCCPTQYKAGASSDLQNVLPESKNPYATPDSSGKKKRGVKPERKSAAELESLGITEPFAEASHRQRPEYSEADDKALWEGFLKHGKRWAEIRADTALGLAQRSAPELRDRFRSRFKTIYERSLLSSEHSEESAEITKLSRDKSKGLNAATPSTSDRTTHADSDSRRKSDAKAIKENNPKSRVEIRHVPEVKKVQAQLPWLQMDDIFFGLPFDNDGGDDPGEPIILDRQILDFGKSHTATFDFVGKDVSTQRLPQISLGGMQSSTALPSLASITAASGLEGVDQLELPSLMQCLGSSESDSRTAGHGTFLNLEELLS